MTNRVPAIVRLDCQVVVVADMAGNAAWNRAAVRDVLVQVGEWESGYRMVKTRLRPIRGVVALRAKRRGEAAGNVIGNITAHRLCTSPFVLMAAVAIGIGRREVVVVVRMAIRAGSCYMRTGERPPGDRVVEGSHVGPRDRIVALRAVCRAECRAGGGVNGVVRLLPPGQVAARVSAIRGSNLQIVVVVDVALGAGDGSVTVRKRESSRRMVKGRRGPTRFIVAGAALCDRESLW